MAKKKNVMVCSLKMANSKISLEMVGKTFGYLYVISYAGSRVLPQGQHQAMILAQCKCGNIGAYVSNHVKHGRSISCGCFQEEKTKIIHTVHGQKRGGSARGSITYSRWRAMIDRCATSTNYLNKNIKVCSRWRKFENFFNDMGECISKEHTLDRIDNKKGYYKENCRWATRTEQANNTSRNVFITINGIKYTLSQAMTELKLGKRHVQALAASQHGKEYHGLSKNAVLKYL